MLYVKNAPSQAVQPVKPILKKKSVLKSPMQLFDPILIMKNTNSEKNKTKIALPAQYSMSFPDKTEVIYILVYI